MTRWRAARGFLTAATQQRCGRCSSSWGTARRLAPCCILPDQVAPDRAGKSHSPSQGRRRPASLHRAMCEAVNHMSRSLGNRGETPCVSDSIRSRPSERCCSVEQTLRRLGQLCRRGIGRCCRILARPGRNRRYRTKARRKSPGCAGGRERCERRGAGEGVRHRYDRAGAVRTERRAGQGRSRHCRRRRVLDPRHQLPGRREGVRSDRARVRRRCGAGQRHRQRHEPAGCGEHRDSAGPARNAVRQERRRRHHQHSSQEAAARQAERQAAHHRGQLQHAQRRGLLQFRRRAGGHQAHRGPARSRRLLREHERWAWTRTTASK